MGCKVEKILTAKGKTSELFKGLQDAMPGARALEYYLELEANKEAYVKLYGKNKQGEVNGSEYMSTPKFKLAEFNTYQQQMDTMDLLTEEFVDALKNLNDTKSASTLSGINVEGLTKDPTVMASIMRDVRLNVLSDVRANGHLYPKEQVALLNQAVANLPSYLVTNTAEGRRLGPLGAKLKDYGINIGISEKALPLDELDAKADEMLDENENIDLETKQTEVQRIYSMSILESSATNSILSQVKVYLRSQKRVDPSYKYSKSSAVPTYQLSELGNERPARYELLVSKLFGVLKGMQNTDQMLDLIQKALPSSPELVSIYNDLVNETPRSLDDGSNQNILPLRTALFTTFAKQDYNMFSIVEKADGAVTVMDSNSSSVQTKMKDRWAEVIKDTQEQLPAEEIKKRLGVVSRLMGENNAATRSKMRKALDKASGPSNITLAKIANVFKQAGFDTITAADLAELVKNVTDNPGLANSPKKKGVYKVPTPFEILTKFVNTLAVPVLNKKDIFTSTNTEFKEGTLLNALAAANGKRFPDMMVGAYYSNRGSIIHPLNASSESQDIYTRLHGDATAMAPYLNDPMYKNAIITDQLLSGESTFESRTMDVLNDNKQSGKGVTYGKLSTYDAINVKLNAFYNHKTHYIAIAPTQADRGNASGVVVPRLNIKDSGSANQVFDKNGVMVDGPIRTWVENQVASEAIRIANTLAENRLNKKNKKSGTVNYAKNGVRFNLFTELNDSGIDVSNLTVNPRTINSVVKQAMEFLDQTQVVKNIVNNDIQYMIDNGVLARTGEKLVVTKNAARVLSDNVGARASKTSKIKEVSNFEADTFLMNNFIYNYEQTLYSVGDMAFFKDKSAEIQMVDLNKRSGLPYTPGTRLAVGPNLGIAETSKVKILEEGIMKSELAEVYNTITGGNKFKNIELADGSGFVSLDRYKALLVSRGLQTDAVLQYIEALKSWKSGPMPKSPTATLEVLKGFYFRLDEINGRITPFNLKYSIMPVIPALFEAKEGNVDKYPGMARISKELRSKSPKSADEVVMQTSVKVGASEVTSLENLTDAGYTTIHNESYRFPQVSPSINKIEDRFGSQVRVLMMGNYNSAKDLVIPSSESDLVLGGAEALELYNESISKLVNNAGDIVYKEFLDGTDLNVTRLKEKLLRDVEQNEFNNSEYFQEALTVLNEAGETQLPLSYPTIKYKIDNLINAAFRNKVNKLTLPGHSAVQVSSYGMMASKNQIDTASDLKFISFQDENGVRVSDAKALKLAQQIKEGKDISDEYIIAPAEVRVTGKFFKGNLRKAAQDRVAEDRARIDAVVKAFAKTIPAVVKDSEKKLMLNTRRAAEVHDSVEREYTRMTNAVTNSDGTYNVQKIKDAGLDEVVLYRIPTQGKNSMLMAKIKDFLPNEMGGTIQVPAEIVDQSGSDFDIDKVYIEMSSFEMDADNNFNKVSYLDGENINISTEAKAKAFIVDFHKGVLSSPEYIREILLPNGTEALTALTKSEEFKGPSSTVKSWASMSTQEDFRVMNKAGKEMIAVSSVASVMHALSPHLGTKFMKRTVIGRVAGQTTGVVDLQRTHTIDGKTLISEEIAEIQNAAVDNANDPLLGKLNLDTYTANAALLLVSAGYGLKFAMAVVNSPAVKELAKVYPKYTRKMGEEAAEKAAIREVIKTFDIGAARRSVKQSYKLDTYTEKQAMINLNPSLENKSAIAVGLQAFLDIKKHGEDLSTFQRTMSFGSKGVPSTASKLLMEYIKVANVPGTIAFSRERTNTGLTKKAPVKTKAYASRKAATDAMVKTTSEIVRSTDETSYELVSDPTVKFERLNDFMNNGIAETNAAIEAGSKAGSTLDAAVRNYFISGVVNSAGMSTSAIRGLENTLSKIKDHFESTGETVITDPKMLLVYDELLGERGVAGEADMVTFDKNMVFRIYDVKGAKKTKASDYNNAEDGATYIKDRKWKRTKQLNGYRALYRNKLGLVAEDLRIIEVPLEYNETGTQITNVKTSKSMFETHDIHEDMVADTRIFETNKTERIVETLGKASELKPSKVGVDKVKYKKSHLSTLEQNTLTRPLEVSRVASPSSSVQYQKVLDAARKSLGFQSENQLTQILVAYDTYLATNNTASKIAKTSLSRRMTTREYLSLSDANSNKATSKLLKNYRNYTIANNIAENQFTENLTIKTENGKSFIVFNNTVARSMTGEVKKDMMFFFEDLMSSKNPIEYQLAKSLADYAITHYGYAKGINSYMEFIPPVAHSSYMNSVKEEQGAVTLPEFFREVSPHLDTPTTFTNARPDVFIDMYVQNNADKLGIRRVTPSEETDWVTQIYEEAAATNREVPTYVLVNMGMGRTAQLWKMGGSAPKQMQLRGIPNLMVEYHTKPSHVNESVGVVEVNADNQKAKASKENKGVMENIDKYATETNSIKEVLDTVGDYRTLPINKDAQVDKFISDSMDALANNRGTLTAADVQKVREQFNKFVKGPIANSLKAAKRRGAETTYNEAFVRIMDGLIETFINPMQTADRNGKILDRIKKC